MCVWIKLYFNCYYLAVSINYSAILQLLSFSISDLRYNGSKIDFVV